jgi:hypothetical protein
LGLNPDILAWRPLDYRVFGALMAFGKRKYAEEQLTEATEEEREPFNMIRAVRSPYSAGIRLFHRS